MTKNSYFIRLALYFVGSMLIIGFLATYFGKSLNHADGIILIFLISHLASKYIIANGNELNSRDYWILFWGSLGIYLLYNIFLAIYLSFLIVLTPKVLLFSMSLVLAVGVLSTFLGLWSAKRAVKRAFRKPVAAKVYSVTDEGIATYLINELSKHKISAYADKLHMRLDPLLSTAPTGEVDIMVNDASDLDKAREIISAFYEEQENRAPWICPKCHEKNEGSFAMCWNCGYAL